MAIAAVIGTSAAATAPNSTVTSSAIDTTGCSLLVAHVSWANGGGGSVASFTDSKSNTWIALTSPNSGSADFANGKFFYCKNPTVGSGHTFTATPGGNAYISFTLEGFSGTLSNTNADQSNSNGVGSATTIQPGSITPSENNELVVCGVGYVDTSTPSIGSGFTIAQHENETANHYGSLLAYKVQTTAAAVNPTTTVSGAAGIVASIASFKAAPVPPVITTTALTDGVLGRYQSQTVSATGSPTAWSVFSGAMPDGWSINNSGVISGAATEIGAFDFILRATSSDGHDDQVFHVEVTVDDERFPNPDIVGLFGYKHYDERPRDFAGITDTYEFEDGKPDFNRRTDSPARIWELELINGLPKATTDIFDAFAEAVGIDVPFDFTDKYGATWQNVRIKNYDRQHQEHHGNDRAAVFTLVQYDELKPVPEPSAWLRASDLGLADAATPSSWPGHLVGQPVATLSSDGTTPTYETNEINGLPVIRLTDGHVSMGSDARFYDVFLVMKVREATFSAARGIICDADNNNFLKGTNATTKFADLSLSDYQYRLNGTLYAANDQQAPMNTFGIVHIRSLSGFDMTYIEIGQSGTDVAGNIDLAEAIAFDTLLTLTQCQDVVNNLNEIYFP